MDRGTSRHRDRYTKRYGNKHTKEAYKQTGIHTDRIEEHNIIKLRSIEINKYR